MLPLAVIGIVGGESRSDLLRLLGSSKRAGCVADSLQRFGCFIERRSFAPLQVRRNLTRRGELFLQAAGAIENILRVVRCITKEEIFRLARRSPLLRAEPSAML